MMIDRIERANDEALRRMRLGDPILIDLVYAKDALALPAYTIGHAGPPITWDRMCGPMQSAILGAIVFEEWASSIEHADQLIQDNRITFISNHSIGAVGPMTGIITRSMPLFKVVNRSFDHAAYCTLNEGLGKVMRFGANGPDVIARLQWLRDEFAPLLKLAVAHLGGIPLKTIMVQAIQMGDELHQRNLAASSLFANRIIPALLEVGLNSLAIHRSVDFLIDNSQFFLNLAMAAGKSICDPARNIPYSTMVTAMSRNGADFGIQVSGLGDQWFTAPVLMPQGLYFPGFTQEDANPDMGDSTIVETMGMGGLIMGAAPAVVRFVGAGSTSDAFRVTNEMREITIGTNNEYVIPCMNFEGIPSGIDIRKVVEKGILPVINTGIAHRLPGVGQIGAGVVHAPLDCFSQAVLEFGHKIGLSTQVTS